MMFCVKLMFKSSLLLLLFSYNQNCLGKAKKNMLYSIFWTIRCTYNPLFFSKMKHAPYSLVHLMCGSGCALSPSCEQILCCNNPYQRNSTYLNSFFLESKLVFSCIQMTYSHSPYKCVFSFHLSSFPSRVYFSLHFTCINIHMHCACIATCTIPSN